MVAPESIRRRADDLHEETTRIRRHLHRHPELSFQEAETARYISSQLDRIGIPHDTDVAGHGIVARVPGARSRGATNAAATRAVALRADFDALPIEEADGREYRSQNPGVMHACGHDVHTSCLLTALRILSDARDSWDGTVTALFQPAEERAPGGARGMIDAGALDNPSVHHVFGQHVNTEIPVGAVGFGSGLFMASADEIYITVNGRGGHAAKPHLAADPVAIASQLIVTLQQIVSRAANPIVPSVLTFGRIIGDGAANVIPDSVRIDGTFRTVDESWRGEALDRIRDVSIAIAGALGGSVDVRIERGYPALVNDDGATTIARDAAIEYLGADRVVDLPPTMWAEDFAYYALERPSCFFNLGVRNDDRGIVHSVHTPRFDVDEDALAVGSGLLAWIAIRSLSGDQTLG